MILRDPATYDTPKSQKKWLAALTFLSAEVQIASSTGKKHLSSVLERADFGPNPQMSHGFSGDRESSGKKEKANNLVTPAFSERILGNSPNSKKN